MACRFAAHIFLAALACGCSALPSYNFKVNAPHKDVLQLVIYLDERAEPGVYQEIALREVARFRVERRQGPPLYEVCFDFQKSGGDEERLAKVVIRFQSDGTPGPAQIVRAPAQRIENTLN